MLKTSKLMSQAQFPNTTTCDACEPNACELMTQIEFVQIIHRYDKTLLQRQITH